MDKKKKKIAFYAIGAGFIGILTYLIYSYKDNNQETSTIISNIQSPFGILLLQIIIILISCRFLSFLFSKIGQPMVLGEIFAGIILGPSILGHWFPDVSNLLFPAGSMENISLLSQIGLILFMFVIGMELNMSEVQKKLKTTLLISSFSVILPSILGILTGLFIFDQYADENQSLVPFALFIGIVMSVTAFPVLARIIRDKGLSNTHLGTISLASAATIDITVWCLLAVVIAFVQAGSIMSAAYNLLFAGLYIVVMFLVIRPFLRMVGQIYHNEEVITGTLVAFVFFILLASAFLTEILGLHILFGAFMAGIIMPPDIKFRKILTEKVESVSLYLLLPLFFVSIGLKTNFWLLNSPDLWILLVVFIAIAFTGKFVGALFSARIAGERWENSLYIGILMNTHGLMELVVLSIGYQMNIISPSIFAIMVLMTLLITFTTSPLMSLVRVSFHFHDKLVALKKQENPDSPFKLLLSFGRAGNGQIMLNVAHQMFSMRDHKMEVTALHFTLGSEVNPLTANDIESVSFRPIHLEASKLDIPLRTQYNVSNAVGKGIATIANEGEYDFMLVGSGIQWSNLPNDIEAVKYHNSIQNRYLKPKAWFFPSEMMEDKTKLFIEQVTCPVGVFINRDFVKASKVLLILDSVSDLYLLKYAGTLLKFTSGSIAIIDRSAENSPEKEILNKHIRQFLEMITKSALLTENDIHADLLNDYNFMLISYVSWKDVSENRREILQKSMPSTLIISK